MKTYGPILLRAASMAWLLAMATVVAGCAHHGEPLVQLNGTSDFQDRVLDDKGPVMVFFYKEGCPKCMLLEPTMEDIAAEYHGKARFVKVSLYGAFTEKKEANELRAWYKITLYPTVILFINGQEKQTWTSDLDGNHYRSALNGIVGPPAPAKASTAKVAFVDESPKVPVQR